MHPSTSQLARELWGEASFAAGGFLQRGEPRETAVRLVEYAPFPRVRSDRGWRVGFTRDLSEAGLCLRAEGGVAPGKLLRIVVRNVDGRPTHDSVARVVWCRTGRDGEAWLGLSLVARRRRVDPAAPELCGARAVPRRDAAGAGAGGLA